MILRVCHLPFTIHFQKVTTAEVEIERILPGGLGLAHAEGRTIFVSLAAPGDVVRVNIERTRGKVAFASIIEIIKPSPVRIEPPCPYFGRCGGCDFQQLTYQAQLEAKLEIIRDCLRRIAHIDPVPNIEIHASPSQWHYRNRANWQVDSRTGSVGYFERGSHRVCDVAECAVLVPELQATLETVRDAVRTGEPEISDTDIDAAAGDRGVSASPAIGGLKTTEISRRIGDETYHFKANTFFQTNHDLLETLIATAIGDARGSMAVDLYCGVGLFTVPLARRFERVVGVESSRTSSEFARRNLRNAELRNATLVTESVAEWFQDLPGESGLLSDEKVADSAGPGSDTQTEIEFLLLDPPRTGAEAEVIKGILSMQPKRISYVSCDPATLARDLKILLSDGYSLDSIAAFDMFPQTHHVETITKLLR